MEPLLQQLDRFSEVLAVSRSTHVKNWDPVTVGRALQWARYLRHVHGRFGRHAGIRAALERRLREQGRQQGRSGPGPVSELTNFESLGRCDILLALRLLENRALGDAAYHHLLQQLFPGPSVPDTDSEGESLQAGLARLARRRAAVHMLRVYCSREMPAVLEDTLVKTQAELLLQRLQEVGAAGAGGLLSRLWGRLSQNSFLKVVAAALLLPPAPGRPLQEGLELDRPGAPREGMQELASWLLGNSDVRAAFCRTLPADLLASVADHHAGLFRVYLGLLTDWGRHLHYDLQKGSWVGEEPQGLSWEELHARFQSLCQAAPPLKDEVLTTLKSYKVQDGDYQVPGLSIWTDLLLALGRGP
ncbi:PREDICTED: LOW QUALITY PROTEIN: Fanconi anemia, complementation group F [Elephantulus edwardii]|uniref:LOW QUALITY PROTEIN: Fanconi anemia, complementation group F n=1 Tax=Elephantulus edwardii TaxID=28737 RepID=UPI0003F0BF75|nr:PREDICTED: LOW QUALITY PROTEIN: Fanconi anemia, complementation group F [Elephantulus edwardii]